MTKGSGTFIGAKLTEQSAKQLVKWMDRVGISDPVPLNELHCTITFDAEREIAHQPMEFSPPIDIDPSSYELKLFGPNKDILVLGFECPELANRFNTLIKRYNITPTYPRYKPHVTLSYTPQKTSPESPPEFGIQFAKEYVKDFTPPPGTVKEGTESIFTNRGEVPVLVNPSWIQLFGFVKRYHQVRGIVVGNTFYFAPASLTYHIEMSHYVFAKLGASGVHDTDLDQFVYLPAVRDQIPNDWQQSPTRTIRGLAVAVPIDAEYNDAWADPRMQKFYRPEPNRLVAEGQLEIVHGIYNHFNDVPVYIDPTIGQLEGFCKRYGELRAIRIAGHTLACPARLIIHDTLAQAASQLGLNVQSDGAKVFRDEKYDLYVYAKASAYPFAPVVKGMAFYFPFLVDPDSQEHRKRLTEMFGPNLVFEALNYTNAMRKNAVGNKCQLIVEMPAVDFIRLTTSGKNEIDQIMKSAKTVDQYNRWSRMGDEPEYEAQVNQGKTYTDRDYEHGSIVHPFLNIRISKDGKYGKVVGHEGRHRAAASIHAGQPNVQVAICLKPGENTLPDIHFGVEYHLTSEHLPRLILGQYSDYINEETSGWKILHDDMQKHVRRYDESLNEARLETVHYNRSEIPVLIDPSPQQLLGFSTRHKLLRGVRINGHMLFAPAHQVVHATLADRIAAELGIVEPFDKAWQDKWEKGYDMYVRPNTAQNQNEPMDFDYDGMRFEFFVQHAGEHKAQFVNGIFHRTGQMISEETDPENFEIINDLPVKKIKSKTTKVTKRYTDLIRDNLKKLGLSR